MRWVNLLSLLLLCLAPVVEAAACTDDETAAALVPYKAELALNLALCGSDVGYSTAAIANGDFFSPSTTTPARVTAFLKSVNCRALFILYQKATSNLRCSTGYQGVTFEQYAATLLPSSAATPTTPTTVKPGTANCTDESATAAFAAIEAERSRFLLRCAIDMGSIPVAYLYNNTLKHKITDAQFTAFLASSDCAAAVVVEKKAWGAVVPPCVLYDGALAFTTREISAWTFTDTTAAPRPVAQSTAARCYSTSALVVLALAAWGCYK
ncbi:hypothetical protein SPRG_13749 [Saprolegnia parasitica CBS 223.65]|uniref:Uncharacterized protein n=1 Tax=Saprolegnia parasitica (strain CBS 223.65) TaxID=695850 RepID=A0A067C0M7_SAPPC|nr:hypothetical protein SPRG_13749 [Saprolegnia parasitica CBS 223.65]KDO20367.1 hypothetical protein SPRG_13749 [Saprolegnia parasitica CBS 223.65]|eukprot:XP_012208895.1 hypothetical protein SPRG_13749 [Saprolegnia parasitica CBS 223.65]